VAVVDAFEEAAELAVADVFADDCNVTDPDPDTPEAVTVGCTVTDCVPEAGAVLATMTEVGAGSSEAGAFLIKVKVSPGASTAPWMYSMLRTEALWTVNLLKPNCLLFKTLVMFKICNLPNSAREQIVSTERYKYQ
jgi:hypothetical protein